MQRQETQRMYQQQMMGTMGYGTGYGMRGKPHSHALLCHMPLT